MSGDEIREKPVLAAVKPLRTVNSLAERHMGEASATQSNELELLFRQHYDRVFRTAHRMTGSAADAEDVLQTVFLRVARGQESRGVADNPQAYFTRAANDGDLRAGRGRDAASRARASAKRDWELRAETREIAAHAKGQKGKDIRNLFWRQDHEEERTGKHFGSSHRWNSG